MLAVIRGRAAPLVAVFDERDRYLALFVRGNPRDYWSQILGSGADNAAFEKRTTAKGFSPIAMRSNSTPLVWTER